MTKTVRTLVRSAALSVALLPALGLTLSAQEVDLKLAWLSADSPTDPYAVAAHAFKDAIEEAMPDRVSVSLFPNRQLGEEKDVLEGLQFGTIDMGVTTNAVVANIEPTYQLVDLPFLFDSAEQAHAVLDGPIGQTLADNLEPHGIVSLGAMEGGFRNMVNNVKPVNAPEDVVGVKYRTMQSPVFIEMFNSLGGNAVPMAWGEVFTAVQQGTIDGLEIPVAVVSSNKLYEITQYLSLTRHTYSSIHLLISERSFDGLPEDVQQAVLEAGRVATERQRTIVAENERAVIASLEEVGMQINEVTDIAPFREAVQSVYRQFEDTIGSDLLNQALEAVQ